ncbi:hypothetical protein E4T48_03676 [Aureobasidium sp. EXF-10727]|nr:hypothetical protein E4T48_03676 [Aureobasidium sp. EXF-10727]KAI4727779.1 hypothetical protein E4T49_04407 [Aureobasidium sp. EXF-10728]
MSSDSELSNAAAPPPDAVLEKTLRDIVRKAEVDPITVKRVRTAAEERLGLHAGFFKGHDEWNEKSKEIIEDAFNQPSQKSPSPEPTPPKKAPAAKAKTAKRASTSKEKPAPKRQKRSVSESEHSDFESEEEEPKPKPARKKSTATTKRVSKETVESDGEENVSDNASEHPDETPATEAQDEEVKAGDDSESEMSVVLDEAPPKKQRKKSASTGTKTKAQPKVKATKAAAKPAKEETPDEAEIKRLQGWLVKCGIRKLWHRELAPYDAPKAKIKHLKEMLKDAGMDGRYSEQKAKTIKERRELEADLEAVQEGAKQWGNEEDSGEDGKSDEGESAPRPQRRAAATRFVDFGEDDDDDE